MENKKKTDERVIPFCCTVPSFLTVTFETNTIYLPFTSPAWSEQQKRKNDESKQKKNAFRCSTSVLSRAAFSQGEPAFVCSCRRFMSTSYAICSANPFALKFIAVIQLSKAHLEPLLKTVHILQATRYLEFGASTFSTNAYFFLFFFCCSFQMACRFKQMIDEHSLNTALVVIYCFAYLFNLQSG